MRNVIFLLIIVLLTGMIGECTNADKILVFKQLNDEAFVSVKLIPNEPNKYIPLINSENLNMKFPDSYTRYRAIYNDSTGCFLSFDVSPIAITECFRNAIIYDLNIINSVFPKFNERDTILHFSHRNIRSYSGTLIDRYRMDNKQFKVSKTKDGVMIRNNLNDDRVKFHFTEGCNPQFYNLIKKYPSEIFFSNLYSWNLKGLEEILHYISPYDESINATRIILSKDSITDIQTISLNSWAIYEFSTDSQDNHYIVETDSLLFQWNCNTQAL